MSNVRRGVFVKGLGFKVGEASSVWFWFDDWVGEGPLCLLYPRVFRVASNKECSVKEFYNWEGERVSWE